MNTIKANTVRFLRVLPEGMQLVVAGKGRSTEELIAAVEGGAQIIGENYVREAEQMQAVIGGLVQWHFIGHLQKNKVKRAVELFDMIETVDSVELACELDKRCAQINKIMPVLIEVNSAREARKSGVMPEHAAQLAREISPLRNIRLMGLMTMGPASGSPEEYLSAFLLTRTLFNEIAGMNFSYVEMKYLSMGMTDSYKLALQAGANIIRIGRGIFGR